MTDLERQRGMTTRGFLWFCIWVGGYLVPFFTWAAITTEGNGVKEGLGYTPPEIMTTATEVWIICFILWSLVVFLVDKKYPQLGVSAD